MPISRDKNSNNLETLAPGQSIELLKALHIVTRDGAINQDSRRKLKQVLHLARFIEPLIDQSGKRHPEQPITLIDHGAGKAYLGFILVDLYLKHRPAQVWGIETRADLVEKAKVLADTLHFDCMHFAVLNTKEAIASRLLPTQVDIVTALHACDTATDDAMRFAIARKASHVVLVPCCQAQVASRLREYKSLMLGKTALSELWRHPIHTREVGAQITNVLRCLALEAAGYNVTVTELVGWEHSLKNELIIANLQTPSAAVAGKAKASLARLNELLDTFGLNSLRSQFTDLMA
jgi:Methyltransferase domain